MKIVNSFGDCFHIFIIFWYLKNEILAETFVLPGFYGRLIYAPEVSEMSPLQGVHISGNRVPDEIAYHARR